MKASVFNALHDGTLAAVAGTIPGEVTLTIECQYLRKKIAEAGDVFIIKLANCKALRYIAYATPTLEMNEFEQIAKLELEILSAVEKDGSVVVSCTNGELELMFENLSIWLNEHSPITPEELASIAEKYWSDWQAKRKHHQMIEDLLRGALALCPVEGAAPATVEECLNHGEWGLAFEVFVDLLLEKKMSLPRGTYDRLQKAGAAMGFSVHNNSRYRALIEMRT